VKKEARLESEQIRQDLCQELNQILNFVTFMGKSLLDHYNYARFICQQSPQLD